MDEQENERINKMYSVLRSVLSLETVGIGYSALCALAVMQAITDEKCTKEIWIKALSETWDFYEEQVKDG